MINFIRYIKDYMNFLFLGKDIVLTQYDLYTNLIYDSYLELFHLYKIRGCIQYRLKFNNKAKDLKELMKMQYDSEERIKNLQIQLKNIDINIFKFITVVDLNERYNKIVSFDPSEDLTAFES